MRTLNLGIVAHVDAGKTTLTERLLYAAGIIDAVGSVDRGNTQTDTLALERERGITIKSAVVAFTLGDVEVNLIDTPGHPDFIAEVERVLSLLDGAVLVVSAVEGVQAQTRVLWRALHRLGIPTLIFVNKVDRMGSRAGAVVEAIAARLAKAAVPVTAVAAEGTRGATVTPVVDTARWVDVLAEHDDALLARFVADERSVGEAELRTTLAGQARRGLVQPVLFGSAITGAGVEALIAGLTEFLPARIGDPDAGLSARVFKIERGPSRERIAYVRVYAGTLSVRDRVELPGGAQGKITGVEVFRDGSARAADAATAGQIARVRGLAGVQIGHPLGRPPEHAPADVLPPPTLESAVVPSRPADKGRLADALSQLAEQDPLIRLRQDDVRGELYVSLYGEVQKEVIQETIARDYGVAAAFRETQPVYVEWVAGSGAAVATIGKDAKPFLATVGLAVTPASLGSGVEFRLEADARTLPLYVFNTRDAFVAAMDQNVRRALEQGLRGWQVTDCVVAMTDCDYASPGTGAGDYRLLTPLVLMEALAAAGTVVCEPVHRFAIDGPADCLSRAMGLLAALRARPEGPLVRDGWFTLEGEVGPGALATLQQQVRSVTRGEGVVEVEFARYEPVAGDPPARPRTDGNPLNREEYMLHLAGRLPS